MSLQKATFETLLRLSAESLYEGKKISGLPLGQIYDLLREKYPLPPPVETVDKYDFDERSKRRIAKRRIEADRVAATRARNWFEAFDAYVDFVVERSGSES
jgi:hypothetical protein